LITKFATVYPGPIDLPDMGQMATPANERRYSNEQLAGVFEKTDVVPGATPAQIEASARRGGWGAAGVPTVQHDMKTGAWFAGPPEELTAYLTDLESRYPGLEYVNVSISMGTPQAVMVEQLTAFARKVMPRFTARGRDGGATG
jgi:hypothetical protein